MDGTRRQTNCVFATLLLKFFLSLVHAYPISQYVDGTTSEASGIITHFHFHHVLFVLLLLTWVLNLFFGFFKNVLC